MTENRGEVKPLVSILIPAYNAQQWLRETLRSAIAQTWERKEIIIVDDGSKDDTLSIAKEFEGDGVQVFTQQNQGAAAARNRAFSLSHGDYIQWLDADDLLGPDKIPLQMEALAKKGAGCRTLLSSSWGRFLHDPNRAVFTPTALWDSLSPVDWLVRKMGQNLYMQTATWLVSREVTEAAGPWDTRLLGDDDGEYFCRVLLASESVLFVPEAKVYYRSSGAGSLSYVGRSDRKMEAQWLSMQKHVAYVRSLEDSERVRAACVKYLENWLVAFYPARMDLVANSQALARELGGELRLPRLSWKYAWIEAAFGRFFAWRAQLFLLGLRWKIDNSLDKAMFRTMKAADSLRVRRA